MFRVHFTNMGHEAPHQFASVGAAKAFGIRSCFEFTVRDEYGIVLAWSPIGGTREYRALTAAGELRADSPR